MWLGLLCGLLTGVFSGLVGLGGGVVMIPFMMAFLGFSQHLAQGTSLAVMLPPVGLLAVWAYYKQGMVDIPVSLWIIAGCFVGGWFGAKLALLIPELWMKRIFGMLLIGIGLKLSLWK